MELTDEVKAVIDRANFAHLATLMANGSPQADPVWIGRDGDDILIGTGAGTLKARNCARDSRVALSIVDHDNPYEVVQLRGTIVEQRPDADLAGMDAIAHKYTGKPFPWRGTEGRILLVLRADRVRHATLPFEHTPA